jgi:hypothetical protein
MQVEAPPPRKATLPARGASRNVPLAACKVESPAPLGVSWRAPKQVRYSENTPLVPFKSCGLPRSMTRLSAGAWQYLASLSSRGARARSPASALRRPDRADRRSPWSPSVVPHARSGEGRLSGGHRASRLASRRVVVPALVTFAVAVLPTSAHEQTARAVGDVKQALRTVAVRQNCSGSSALSCDIARAVSITRVGRSRTPHRRVGA